MASSDGTAPRAADVLYFPVRFTTSEETWWAMADSGAQVSLISTGIVGYLGLIDSEGARMLPSKFTVSGFQGG